MNIRRADSISKIGQMYIQGRATAKNEALDDFEIQIQHRAPEVSSEVPDFNHFE